MKSVTAKVKIEQADGKSGKRGGYHQFLKKQKHRIERHRAKADPETQPLYRAYAGYET